MVGSEEAAARLGVKTATLYAYVSRGLLASYPAPGGRRSLFVASEVEALARRSRRGRSTEPRMATVTTGITELTPAGPRYRGRPATGLAGTVPFEEVTELLWTGRLPEAGPDPGRPWAPVPLGPPPVPGAADRLRWAVVLAGAADPLRSDLRPATVHRAARSLVATMVDALAAPSGADPTADVPPLVLEDGRTVERSVAGRLAARLHPAPDPGLVRAVNGALVLLADHELAPSTVAVRVAASTRADCYDAVLAGLGTQAGPLHGGASPTVHSLLQDARAVGVERALDDAIRWAGRAPGFGHTVYTEGDARAGVLLRLVERTAPEADVRLVHDLLALAEAHGLPFPNVDLGLAALSWSAGLGRDAGQLVFAVARVVGWVAHYLEELEERPLRYRARAVYAPSAAPPTDA
jgi:citrate synthase